MNRKILVEQHLQKGHLLTIKTGWYREFLKNSIIPLMREDFKNGDATTDLLINNNNISDQLNHSVSNNLFALLQSKKLNQKALHKAGSGGWIYTKPPKFFFQKTLVGENKLIDAIIISKQEGIIAGLEEARFIYKEFGIEVNDAIEDGTRVITGDKIMRISGYVDTILKTERKILDLISRMSGISTMTKNMRMLVHNKIGIAGTRKTLLNYLDKKAIFIGGGLTHRLTLSDGILIKNNHIRILNKMKIGFGEIIINLMKSMNNPIIVEVNNETLVMSIIPIFNKQISHNDITLIIMFDNIQPYNIKRIIKKLKDISLSNNILFEASGNITQDNIGKYIDTGVDYVSMGVLTHSVNGFDVSLEII